MQQSHLYTQLKTFDPQDIDQIFGTEQKLFDRQISKNLASVQRVALFTESFLPKVDGVSKSAYLTMRYLEQTGREVLIFAPDIAPTKVSRSQVIPLRSVGLRFAPETRIALPNLSIGRHLDEFQPDLIHLFSPAMMCMSGMIAGRKRHIPVVANYQTDLPGYANQHYGFKFIAPVLKKWLRFIHNRSHATLVPSNYTRVQNQHDGYRRMKIWKRGVDLDRFNPKNKRQEWRERLLNGRDPNALLCIYVGRLAPEKRIDLLLEVAKTPNVALTIIGDGASRRELEALFVGTDTHFTGYLFGEDLSYAFASTDVFLFPGCNETFGQVVQEAMAAGLPPVIVNQGGITDLVADGVNGFICEEDAQSFVSAIEILRDKPDLREKMSIRSRQLAEQYPWHCIMNQLEDYYRHALSLNERYMRLYRPTVHLKRSLSTQLPTS